MLSFARRAISLNRNRLGLYSAAGSLSKLHTATAGYKSCLVTSIQTSRALPARNLAFSVGGKQARWVSTPSTRKITSFKDLGVKPLLCQSLKENFDIHTPTAVQKVLTPTILKGQDILLRDQTGSGKTFGTVVSILSLPYINLTQPAKAVKCVVVVPSIELANQILLWTRELVPADIVTNLDPLLQVLITDKSQLESQVKRLQDNIPQIVVGTPGRLLELVESNQLDLSQLELLMMDEADHMLRLPKRYASTREIYIREKHPKPAQLLADLIFKSATKSGAKPQFIASSATINRPLRHFLLGKGWIGDAVFIDATKGTAPPAKIVHHCLMVNQELIRNIELTPDPEMVSNRYEENVEKVEPFSDSDDVMLESVAAACQAEDVQSAVIFVPSGTSISDFIFRLEEYGISPTELSQRYHKSNLGSKEQRIYIATEHVARGIDIPDLSHVFIVGLPSSPTSYLHMAGRSGRMGKRGKVITFIGDYGKMEEKVRSMYSLLGIDVKPFEHVQ
ncbi:P-loop containing nucleoside triphosphate hydrolase protein [Basidiobolus meristosporus CBS 931.73]|uniref:RNA helicase n=1 Tax=Basidiobolus meristosporus CBS 931.73 TaxID=1314790 RepID=A0A1Y1XXU4_9FUNG|nr:P-loop containing nucleoside triphosphate hydrolase protein [Basidiobolus meristosporus CBS 931.73]|eukprot:ORX90568.1 P-loop containing nucleoside triphosphate hydrolase protein [Basidiobolus meristosporus CBS 931.73]